MFAIVCLGVPDFLDSHAVLVTKASFPWYNAQVWKWLLPKSMDNCCLIPSFNWLDLAMEGTLNRACCKHTTCPKLSLIGAEVQKTHSSERHQVMGNPCLVSNFLVVVNRSTPSRVERLAARFRPVGLTLHVPYPPIPLWFGRCNGRLVAKSGTSRLSRPPLPAEQVSALWDSSSFIFALVVW